MISLRHYVARLARRNRHETTTTYTRGRLDITIECTRCGSLARVRSEGCDLIGLDEPCIYDTGNISHNSLRGQHLDQGPL